ncbi:MAG: DUF309 domain-containing protein [Nitrospirota bacterium]|nr:DUF309 domain-containing protein [Nitrospirota bacterium]
MGLPQMSFDMGGVMTGMIVHALETPEKAAPVGWLSAFLAGGGHAMPLSELAREWNGLPDYLKGDRRGPASLLETVPVFAVALADGQLLTDPHELARVDWTSPNQHLTLFDGVREHLPFLKQRCTVYQQVLSEWFDPGSLPQPGLPRLCHQYAALYNNGLFLEAYKLLELRWMVEQGPSRELLRGMMQIAVSLHQVENGKFAIQQLEEGYFRIKEHSDIFPAPTIGRFVKRLEKAVVLFKSCGPEGFRDFDMRIFPRMWMVSPWWQLFSRRARSGSVSGG